MPKNKDKVISRGVLIHLARYQKLKKDKEKEARIKGIIALSDHLYPQQSEEYDNV